jgi:DNA-binding SARP family transcriptional activator
MVMFRVLGPVEAASASKVEEFNGRLQRTLLLLLLVNRNNLVQTESLIGELWDGRHPGHVVNALHAHVSRLRRRLAALEPERECDRERERKGEYQGPPRLHTEAVGYQLSVADHELDAVVFEQGIERVRTSDYAPALACLELRRLLGMWSGSVFGGGASASWTLQAAATRYAELRISGLELLFDHELTLGRYTAVIPELAQLVAEHPFKERFHWQLMIALYRAGRQNDALDVYRRLRHRLGEDLGLVPSPEMRAFERALIEHDRILWDERAQGPDALRRFAPV